MKTRNPQVSRRVRRIQWAIFSLLALLTILTAGLVSWSSSALAQVKLPEKAPAENPERQEPPEVQVAPDSPRASLSQFLDAARQGRHEEAARFLDLGPKRNPRAPELAKRLKAVLDAHIWFDLNAVSPLSWGNPDDRLPRGVDEVGQIPIPGGEPASVRLVRRNLDGGRWLFSQDTTSRIDDWYATLDGRWLLDRLHPVLLRSGPKDLMIWQWLAIPLLLIAAWSIGHLLGRITRRVLAKVAAGTETTWDDRALERLAGPITWSWTIAAVYLLLPMLGLYQPAEAFAHQVLRAVLFLIFFWALARGVDVARQVVAESPWAKEHPASRSLLPLAARVGKVVLSAVAVVALLSELGYPVASLIAGLGVGGLAVALAAQKTVENLFGAFSIGADEPFREGDFVKIEDFVGTVESIGLRSTKIRTLDRTLITLPNGKLADMRLESFTARDRIRLFATIGVVYSTSAAAMREIMEGFRQVLREHPKIWPDSIAVRFASFGDSSLNIEIMAWFLTTDFDEFCSIRGEVFLSFMDVVDRAKSSFAFPTRTVHLSNEGIVATGEQPSETNGRRAASMPGPA